MRRRGTIATVLVLATALAWGATTNTRTGQSVPQRGDLNWDTNMRNLLTYVLDYAGFTDRVGTWTAQQDFATPRLTPTPFASLSTTADDGTMQFCCNCEPTIPCNLASGQVAATCPSTPQPGVGTIAQRISGFWACGSSSSVSTVPTTTTTQVGQTTTTTTTIAATTTLTPTTTTTTSTTLPTDVHVVAPGVTLGSSTGTRDCTPASTGSGTLAAPYTNLYYAMTQAGGSGVACGSTVYLHGGTYNVDATTGTADTRGLFVDTTSGNRQDNCDDDTTDDGGAGVTDGTRTVLPVFKVCTVNTPIVIKNYPGEDVILEGTTQDWAGGSVWTQCGSTTACGTAATGLTLDDRTKTYYATITPCGFSSGAPCDLQMWVNPSATSLGDRLGWMADTTAVVATNAWTSHDNFAAADLYPGQDTANPIVGRFASLGSTTAGDTTVIARLSDTYVAAHGGSYDPDAHSVRVANESGYKASTAAVVTMTGAKYITLMGNTTGSLRVRYGYPGIMVNGSSDHITIDNVKIEGAGGFNYGNAIRVLDGNQVTVANSTVTESAGEAIAFYGGQSGNGGSYGIQTTQNVATRNTITKSGRGYFDGGSFYSATADAIKLKNCSSCQATYNTIDRAVPRGIYVTMSTGQCAPTGSTTPSVNCSSDGFVVDGNTIYDYGYEKDLSNQSLYPVPMTTHGDGAGVAVEVVRSLNHATNGYVRNNIIRAGTSYRRNSAPIAYQWSGVKLLGGTGTGGFVKLDNNTIRGVYEFPGGTASTPYYGVDMNEVPGASATIVFLRNNIIYDAYRGVYHVSSNPPTTVTSNMISGPDTQYALLINGGGTCSGTTPTQLEACGWGSRNLTPTFVSATDSHLGLASLGIDIGYSGAPITGDFTLDVDGQARGFGSGWDIGADEVSTAVSTTTTTTSPITTSTTTTTLAGLQDWSSTIYWWAMDDTGSGPRVESGGRGYPLQDCTDDTCSAAAIARETTTKLEGSASAGDFGNGDATTANYLRCWDGDVGSPPSGYVDCAAMDVGAGDSFSFGAFVNRTNKTLQNNMVFSKYDTSTNTGYRLYLPVNVEGVTLQVGNVGSDHQEPAITSGLGTATWGHVEATFDNTSSAVGNVMVWLRSGAATNSSAASAANLTDVTGNDKHLTIGKDSAETMSGFVDEAYFFPGALTAAQHCRICSCGVTGSRCTCTGTAFNSVGLNASNCGSCSLSGLSCTASAPTP